MVQITDSAFNELIKSRGYRGSKAYYYAQHNRCCRSGAKNALYFAVCTESKCPVDDLFRHRPIL